MAAWGDTEVDRDHPLLQLEAALFDIIDPLYWATHLHAEPIHDPRHVLQLIGRQEDHVPEAPQVALARRIHVSQVVNGGAAPLESLVLAEQDPQGNANGATSVAAIFPVGDDALFGDPDAARQVDTFLATAVVDDDAPIVPR